MGFPKSKILLFPYFLLLIAAFCIPTDGNHGIFSIKSLTLLGSIGLACSVLLVQQKVSIYQLKLLIFLLSFTAFFLIWFMLSTAYEQTTFTSQADQLKLFITTIIVPVLTLFFIDAKLMKASDIFLTIIYASLFYATTKILLIILHLSGIINVWKVLATLGIQFMRMDIYGGLERLQTSVDIASPFLIFFVLQSDNLNLNLSPKFKRIYITFSLLSTFFGFSRYLLGVYFISCALHWMTLNKKALVKTFSLLLLSMLIIVCIVGPEAIYTIIERRFFSVDAVQSDDARVVQVQAMFHQFDKNPFFGTGIGGFAPLHVRHQTMKHLYEVQWIAFLMQFGIMGLLLLMTPLFFIIFKFLNAPFSRTRLAFLGLFIVWILSGFTNPFLISLTSGVMYILFYISASVLKNQQLYLSRNLNNHKIIV